MIRPPGRSGVAFSERSDGDLRADDSARRRISDACAISPEWATVTQVHGDDVVRVSEPGPAGAADAVWTTEQGLPVAIFTADCLGVVLRAEGAIGVAHAGWRGAAAGVIPNLAAAMSSEGYQPSFAAIGPGIGPCCFEVGVEVADRFGDTVATTTWGTTSVDLATFVERQLSGVALWRAVACTMHESDWFSHRANATRERMAALGWL